MKLNEQQILQIKGYIQSRGFTDLEVGTEILDHVASAVENELNENPEMSIEEAIYNVHWSFGLFGFDRMAAAVTQGLRQHLWQLYKNSFWEQWSTRRVLFNLSTACMIFLLLITLQQTVPARGIAFSQLSAVVIISFIPMIYHFKIFRNWKKRAMVTGKFLVPYIGAGFWIAWPLQFIPMHWNGIPIMTGYLIIASIWMSANLLTGLSMVSEIHKWTYERWLKYQS